MLLLEQKTSVKKKKKVLLITKLGYDYDGWKQLKDTGRRERKEKRNIVFSAINMYWEKTYYQKNLMQRK
jgi:hypothetical protein